MSDDFECPHCDSKINMNDYPDHMADMKGNRFCFECENCRASFQVYVEFDPVFYVEEDTVTVPVTK